MIEVVCNLHIHSTYSDGSGDYSDIASQALSSNVDVVIITDHNIRVKGLEKVIERDGKRVLILTGEEVHDANRMPQKNHLLVIGCNREAAPYAYDPQRLIGFVNRHQGLTFLAHPFEYALPLFNEKEISWDSWEVNHFTGIELWNGFSEFKTVVHTLPQALYYAFFPNNLPHGPLPQTLNKWDELLAKGQKVVAIAGSDAHALIYRLGPFHKKIFPYRYHFSAINNHLLLNQPLTGGLNTDRELILNALGNGSSFIGNDLLAPSQGFTFTAENEERQIYSGQELSIQNGATFRVSLPARASLRLIHNGVEIESVENADHLVKTIVAPGAYRVEAALKINGKLRGWIFSNPIYIRKDRVGLH